YTNQPWPPYSAPVTPPQMPSPVVNTPSYNNNNNNMPMHPGRYTPPPASNIPSSQPLAQPGSTPAPRNPSQPIANFQYSPMIGATPAPAPGTQGNGGQLGRPGPASLSGIAEAPTISAPTPHIFVEIDGKMVQEVRLDKPVLTVGRQDGRDIQIRHQSVSRTHARVLNENGTWFVEDAGSVNGIVANGQRVQRVAIHNGDRVLVAPNIALLYRVM
ncbi:MAG: FHA domain-containing protein, partial [Ktedonobacteraceae bacterium]|nr:FHA domain-containing protein [Ktedonobacteraceae bacterium]